jgi:tRNA pseudouridine55 synthase
LVCVGPATRLTEYAHRQPKRYRAEFLLGQRSPTDDVEVEPELIADAPVPTLVEIESVLPKFVGDIKQRPPVYSAVKIKGQRAYDLARRGEKVEISARTVTIHSLAVARYDYPKLVLDVACGSGTYIRSVGRDLAESLGTAAVMSALERTAIGPFTVDAACDVDAITADSIESQLMSPVAVLTNLPQIQLSDAEVEEVRNGRPIVRELLHDKPEIAAFDGTGRLIAIMRPRNDGQWWPLRNFAS